MRWFTVFHVNQLDGPFRVVGWVRGNDLDAAHDRARARWPAIGTGYKNGMLIAPGRRTPHA